MSNKSEATWHPNAAPEVPHADLMANLRVIAESAGEVIDDDDAMAAQFAIDVLGGSVPREQYRGVGSPISGKCIERGHAGSQHNDLGYCRTETKAQGQCTCATGWTVQDERDRRAEEVDRRKVAERERDEDRAERDALARKLAEVRSWRVVLGASYAGVGGIILGLDDILDAAPAVSLALHDAEVWDQGVRAKSASSSIFDADVFAQNPYRAESK